MPRRPEIRHSSFLLSPAYFEALKRSVPAWTPVTLAAARIQMMHDARINRAVREQFLSHGFDPAKWARP